MPPLTPLDTDLYRLLCGLESRSTITPAPNAWRELEAAGRVTIEEMPDEEGAAWRVNAIVRKRGPKPKAKAAKAAR